jgi:hypothetical protein
LSTTACKVLAVLALGSVCGPTRAAAQFSDPCEIGCIAVLGATSFVTATGISVAAGRITGGLTSVNHGLLLWGASFAATAGAGMALSGNGERQERAVYAAGLGTLAGGLAGGLLAISLGGDEAHVISRTLVGAAAVALIGGVVGALSWSEEEGGGATPLFSVRLPL